MCGEHLTKPFTCEISDHDKHLWSVWACTTLTFGLLFWE